MSLADKSLVAIIVRASEWTLIVMGAKMLFQAAWAIKRPVAAVVGAVVCRATGLLLFCWDRRRRGIGSRGIIARSRAFVARIV